MTQPEDPTEQDIAEQEVDDFRQALGPFVVAAETARTPMVFTNAKHADNPIIFANDSVLLLTGFERAEIVGQPINFLLLTRGDAEAVALVADQFSHDTHHQAVTVEFRHKNGGAILVAMAVSPVRDSDGDVVQHFSSFIDLTASRGRYQREQRSLHTLYQHAPGLISIMEGPNHRFTFANSAYRRLVGHREVLGRAVAEALPEIVEQGFIELLDEVYSTGQPFSATGMPVRLHAPGQHSDLRFVDFIYQPVRDADGKVCGIFCQGHDVTEHKLVSEKALVLQRELIHLSRVSAMGTMATTLAHELNQPLTAISNYSAAGRNLVSRDPVDLAVLDDAFKAVGESSARAGQIIRRLRDMAKKGEPEREIFDLNEAVREAIALVRLEGFDGVSIIVSNSGGVGVEADRVQIQQVIMNLARNACEAVALSDVKQITVATSLKEEDVVVTVSDTGAGVSPEVAETLFEWSDSRKPEGMGIGLSICRTIVEAHEGAIWLGISGPEGASLSFSLPLPR